MLTVSVDPVVADSQLSAGALMCPCDGTLARWGHARPRTVVGGDRVARVRPRRGRCRRCGVTHVLLPAGLLVRRGHAVELIGRVLELAAVGMAVRRIVDALRVARSTGASNRHLAYLGQVNDVTHEAVDALDDDRRRADTMLELGRAVAATRASTDPPSDILVVARPTAGDLGEVIIDVIGLGDDAVKGLRLHVFGQPIRTDGGFGLKSVEQTLLCGRGVSGDGLCI